MRISFMASMACSTMFVASCGGTDSPQSSNTSENRSAAEEQISASATTADTETTAPDTPASTTDTPEAAATPDQAALLRKGRIVFLRCRSCHTLEQGGAHLTGPNLYDLFGATAGQKEGYAFSDALMNSTIVWNAETLDPWLENPSSYVPSNRMVFAGLPKSEDRDALIAYLIEETQ